MKRLLATVAIAACATLGLVRAPAAEVVLKLGHQNNPGHSIHESAVKFAELVGEKTNGEVKIEVFPSAQLGGLNQLWTGVKIGSIEMAGSLVPAVGADFVPGLMIYDAPYAFKDLDHFHRVSRGAVGQELNKRMVEKTGVRILFYQTFGIRNLTANKEIHTPDDLKGMKVRSVTLPGFLATVEGLGATPTPIDFSEVYQSLRTGIVDGQENPVSTIHSAKLYEVQKYLMLTEHIFGIVAVMINEKVYQSLSPEAQTAMQEAALAAADYGDGLAMKEEKELKGKLREVGMTIVGPEQGLDLEAFRTRVRGHVYPKFEDKWGDFMKQVEALAQ